MFPEMARECAYKGAESCCARPATPRRSRHAWKITNQANAFQNLMVTASVCLCGSDGSFDSMGEGMFCNFDGTVMVEGGGRPDEIITCELRPDLVREARTHWGVENNLYQLWHRGYVAVKGGAMDCPYTFMHDMVAGTLPAAVGGRRRARRRHVVRLRGADASARARQPAARAAAERAQGGVTTMSALAADAVATTFPSSPPTRTRGRTTATCARPTPRWSSSTCRPTSAASAATSTRWATTSR